MQITRATDYAVRVMVTLAAVPDGQKMQLETLAEATGVRATFLSKILQRLVHRGLVLSHRGTGGGFCLKVLPDSVTLLEVIEAMEGPLQLNVCMGEGTGCERKTSCATYPYWLDARTALKTVLSAVSIAQLAEQTAANFGSHLDVRERKN
jgi:Rrf2 family protein